MCVNTFPCVGAGNDIPGDGQTCVIEDSGVVLGGSVLRACLSFSNKPLRLIQILNSNKGECPYSIYNGLHLDGHHYLR